MLYNEGKLRGKLKRFPTTIGKNRYETQDDLIKLLDEELEKLIKIEGTNLMKCLNTALFTLGINEDESVCLADRRTLDILRKYEFYKNAPHLIDSHVWFEAVIILNKQQPRLF